MGLLIIEHIYNWMVYFINNIRMTKMPIDWATIFSDNLHQKLVVMRVNPRFYMIAYMVYLLVEKTIDYLGLYKRGSMKDANAWPYVVNPHLVKKNLSK